MHRFKHDFGKHFEKKFGPWHNKDWHDKHDAKPDPINHTPDPTPDPKPEPTPTPEPNPVLTPTQLETAFLKLINEDRAKAGAHALTVDSELIDAARSHSAWMDKTDVFSHTGEGGSSPTARMEDAGYDAVRTAENIAYIGGSRADVLDMSDVVQLHTNLMNSAGHRANLLNPALTEIGIGLHQGDIKGMSAIFVTQDFGTPTAAEAAEDAVGLAGIHHDTGAFA